MLSFLAWGIILIIPWLGLSGSKVALTITILIVAGEVFFYLSILIIGKEYYQKYKDRVTNCFKGLLNKNTESKNESNEL